MMVSANTISVATCRTDKACFVIRARPTQRSVKYNCPHHHHHHHRSRSASRLLAASGRRPAFPTSLFTNRARSKASCEARSLVQSQQVGDNGAPEVPAEGKDELECDSVSSALDAVSSGRPVAILDAADREGETDLFVPAITMAAADLRLQRTAAGGELYIAVGHEVASAFGFPFAGDALAAASSTFPVLSGMAKYNGDMCQGSCSVGLSLDHRSTHTGAPDNERSLTCRRLAEMARDALEVSPDDVERNGAAFGGEFHVPGHVFMCTEAREGLAARQGHTELAVALGRAAGVVPVMVGCVMLCNEGDDFGALPPAAARAWCTANGVPFLDGKALISELAPKGPQQ